MVRVADLSISSSGFAPSEFSPQGNILQAVGEAGIQYAKYEEEKRQRDTEIYLNENLFKFKNEQTTKFEEFKNNYEDLETFTDKFKEQFDNDFNELTAGLGENVDRATVVEKFNQLKQGFVANSVDFQINQKVALAKQSRETAIDNTIQGALLDGDFDGAEAQLGELLQSAASQTTPEELGQLRQKAQRTFALTRIQDAIDKNPASARDSIAKYGEALTAEDSQRLINRANEIIRIDTERRNKLFESDVIEFANQYGDVKTRPIDLTNTESLMNRAEDAARISETYGNNIQFFSKAEAKAIEEQMASMPVEAALEISKNIAFAFGDNADTAFGQIKNQNIGYAAGLAVNAGQDDTAISILNGERVMAIDKALAPSDADANYHFATTVGNAFQHNPEASAAIRAAAKANYVTLAQRAGATTFDAEIYVKALKQVLGDINGEEAVGDYNGGKFILPPGVTNDEFETFIEGLTPEMLVGFSAGDEPPRYDNGKIATPEEIKDEAVFELLNANRYWVKMTSDSKYLSGGGEQGRYVLEVSPDIVKRMAGRVLGKKE